MITRARRRVTVTLTILALLIAGGFTLWSARAGRPPAPAADTTLERLDVYGRVPPFALTERSGRHVQREDLRGLVWVADFIYTECTETCPTQSLQLAQLQDEFGDARDLRFVSITVDPLHDTPEVLRAYAERYRATDRWWFLTGDKRAIYCLAKDGFRLGVLDPSASGPVDCGPSLSFGPAPAWASHGSKGLVMHSARIVLIDRAGRIRAYHLATDPESMKNLRFNVRRLLKERADAK